VGLAAAWRADGDLVRAAVRLTLLSDGGPGVDLPLTFMYPGTGLRQGPERRLARRHPRTWRPAGLPAGSLKS
jgi:hypothetical protein